jgi:hypothetical protein
MVHQGYHVPMPVDGSGRHRHCFVGKPPVAGAVWQRAWAMLAFSIGACYDGRVREIEGSGPNSRLLPRWKAGSGGLPKAAPPAGVHRHSEVGMAAVC